MDEALLNAKRLLMIRQMNAFYIYKPWRAIARRLAGHTVVFFVFALMTFHIFAIPMAAVWVLYLYRFYITLKWLEKFNLSPFKIAIFFVFLTVGMFVAASAIRPLIAKGYQALCDFFVQYIL